VKITFVSNYINHHQIPLAEELFQKLGSDYRFIETEPMEDERVSMGWDSKTSNLPYLLQFYKSEEECKDLIMNSDIVAFGGCDDESYIYDRLKAHKPVIRISERIYKSGQWKAISPRGLIKKYQDHTSHRKDPVILLCAGAYTPSDFNIVKAYPDKMYRWGYFPPTREYDFEKLWETKKKETPEILWAGRFIDWKHPEAAISVANRLRKDNISFKLTMIGGGVEEDNIRRIIDNFDLSSYISLEGFKSPLEVREYMERADVFLFTSDYLEGWGAVLNEAMNSGCAVVANAATGATPYLISQGENGFAYENKDLDSLYKNVKQLVTDEQLRREIGKNAYSTITEIWNASKAAEAFIELSKALLGNKEVSIHHHGPGSKAKVIPERKMYQSIVKHLV